MPKRTPLIGITHLPVTCGGCGLRPRCFPVHLSGETISALSTLVKGARPVESGTCVIRQGDPATSLYITRMGSAKGVLGSADGTEQVIAFYYPSEMIGFDSLERDTYRSSVFALERSSFCEIPVAAFESLCQRDPEIFHRLVRDLARALAIQERLTLELSKLDAEQRLAAFLFDLSRRQRARGLSPSGLHFSMSRYDIANHLGMASETVSRAFTHFEHEGILEVARKFVTIHNPEGLRQIANPGRTTTQNTRSHG